LDPATPSDTSARKTHQAPSQARTVPEKTTSNAPTARAAPSFSRTTGAETLSTATCRTAWRGYRPREFPRARESTPEPASLRASTRQSTAYPHC